MYVITGHSGLVVRWSTAVC